MADLNRTAAKIARDAIECYKFSDNEEPRKIWLAGPLPPPGESYHPGDDYSEAEFDEIYKQVIEGVKEEADFLIAETLSSAREGLLISRAAQKYAPEKELFVCFTVGKDLKIRNGDSLEDTVKRIEGESPEQLKGFGVNCSFPDDTHEVLKKLGDCTDKPIIAYPNDFSDFDKEWVVTESKGVHIPHRETPADKFRDTARILLRNKRLRILGGCCATIPDHIAQIRYLLDS